MKNDIEPSHKLNNITIFFLFLFYVIFFIVVPPYIRGRTPNSFKVLMFSPYMRSDI
jgi:hypothetical protein